MRVFLFVSLFEVYYFCFLENQEEEEEEEEEKLQ
jgi:hypothetical protein